VTRSRVTRSEERAREVTRVQNTLEGMTITLGDVVSDVMGKDSHMIVCSMADGESEPSRIAREAALTGTIGEHHRFLLREHLTPSAHLEAVGERITKDSARRFSPPDPKRAGMAVAHRILVMRYPLVREGVPSEEYGMPSVRNETGN
jgi:hypothetical protein